MSQKPLLAIPHPLAKAHSPRLGINHIGVVAAFRVDASGDAKCYLVRKAPVLEEGHHFGVNMAALSDCPHGFRGGSTEASGDNRLAVLILRLRLRIIIRCGCFGIFTHIICVFGSLLHLKLVKRVSGQPNCLQDRIALTIVNRATIGAPNTPSGLQEWDNIGNPTYKRASPTHKRAKPPTTATGRAARTLRRFQLVAILLVRDIHAAHGLIANVGQIPSRGPRNTATALV